MLRQDSSRIDPKRRNVDYRKAQFANPTYKETQYPHRLNFYETPPTADITLEQFEQWAIDRLRGILLTNLPSVLVAILTTMHHSSCRVGSMLVPQQIPSRDGSTHEAATREISAAPGQHIIVVETFHREAKRSLQPLHTASFFLVNRRLAAAVQPRRVYALPLAVRRGQHA